LTKIDIVSGFLGAGKTTLIKKLVSEAIKNEKVVLIENEFGEVGIDGGFLKDAGIQITEMNSGCICCTMVGDFEKNLKEVYDKFSPDRIIIEPSGVGKLSDVMASVVNMEKDNDVKLNALVTVVNAKKAKKQMKAFGEFFNNQIEFATTVILSRADEADNATIEEVVNIIREKNAKALIVTTSLSELSGEKILNAIEGKDNLDVITEAMKAHEEHEHEHHHHDHDHDEHEHHHHDHDHEEHEHHHHDHDHEEHEHHHEHDEHCTCGCHDHHHHHHADDVFESFGRETPKVFKREVIENALKELVENEEYGIVLRSKGMIPAEDGTWIYFDFVDGDFELRTGQPDVTGRIVVIGSGLNEEKISELFGL
jgi:G3E family GTPase